MGFRGHNKRGVLASGSSGSSPSVCPLARGGGLARGEKRSSGCSRVLWRAIVRATRRTLPSSLFLFVYCLYPTVLSPSIASSASYLRPPSISPSASSSLSLSLPRRGSHSLRPFHLPILFPPSPSLLLLFLPLPPSIDSCVDRLRNTPSHPPTHTGKEALYASFYREGRLTIFISLRSTVCVCVNA